MSKQLFILMPPWVGASVEGIGKPGHSCFVPVVETGRLGHGIGERGSKAQPPFAESERFIRKYELCLLFAVQRTLLRSAGEHRKHTDGIVGIKQIHACSIEGFGIALLLRGEHILKHEGVTSVC